MPSSSRPHSPSTERAARLPDEGRQLPGEASDPVRAQWERFTKTAPTPEFKLLAFQIEQATQQDVHLHQAAGMVPESDLQGMRASVAVQKLAEFSRQASEYARERAVLAIRMDVMSRVHAAALLGVHQATVARWVKEAEAKDAAPITVPSEIPEHPNPHQKDDLAPYDESQARPPGPPAQWRTEETAINAWK
jgi:hypothetical protein